MEFVTRPTTTIAGGNMLLNQVGSYAWLIEGLTPITKYYVRGYSANSVGTTDGNDMLFTTATLKIGDSYHGGKIAFLDATGLHGLLAAPADQSTNALWSGVNTLCNDLVVDGFNDWKLPTVSELMKLLH